MHRIILSFSSRYFGSDVLPKHSVNMFKNDGHATYVKQLSKIYMLLIFWNFFPITGVQFQISVRVT